MIHRSNMIQHDLTWSNMIQPQKYLIHIDSHIYSQHFTTDWCSTVRRASASSWPLETTRPQPRPSLVSWAFCPQTRTWQWNPSPGRNLKRCLNPKAPRHAMQMDANGCKWMQMDANGRSLFFFVPKSLADCWMEVRKAEWNHFAMARISTHTHRDACKYKGYNMV